MYALNMHKEAFECCYFLTILLFCVETSVYAAVSRSTSHANNNNNNNDNNNNKGKWLVNLKLLLLNNIIDNFKTAAVEVIVQAVNSSSNY